MQHLRIRFHREFHFPLSDHKSWSIARSSNFSYSNKGKFSPGNGDALTKNQPDDILDSGCYPKVGENDMVHKKNLLNSKLRMAGGNENCFTLFTLPVQSLCNYRRRTTFFLKCIAFWDASVNTLLYLRFVLQ